MDVKSLLEKLLFDEVPVDEIEEPLTDVKPVETVKPIEPIKVEEPPKEPVVTKVVETPKPAPVKKAYIDVTEHTYRPNYKTAASMEKAQYVRQEPLSPIFGLVSDKEKGEEKKLTTPQFPSFIEGSKKVESVLSPIFGKDIPTDEEPVFEEQVEEIVTFEKPLEFEEEKVEEQKPKAEVKEAPVRYTPRHADIKPEDNDVFYTNGLELDKIISLLNETDESISKVEDEDTSFLDSVLGNKEEDNTTISIFDDAE